MANENGNGRRYVTLHWLAIAAVGGMGVLILMMLNEFKLEQREQGRRIGGIEVRIGELATLRSARADQNDQRWKAHDTRIERLEHNERTFRK